MVELDEQHRAVDPVIERTHLVTGTDPGERGVRQMLLHFRKFDLSVTGTDTADLRLQQADKEALLFVRQLAVADAFGWDFNIVAEPTGKNIDG